MYLKLQEDLEKSITYRINSDELTIGSGPSCLVVIKNSFISKKHLKIFRVGDSWFVSDQGSTNGSYLGDEKLIPGKKYLLNPYQNIRVGHQISLELVTKADSFLELPKMKTEVNQDPHKAMENSSSDQDKTLFISLEEFNSKVFSEEARRKIQLEKRTRELAEIRVERKRLVKIVFLAALVVWGGLLINKKWKIKLSFVGKETIIKKMQARLKSSSEIDVDMEGYRILREDIIPRKVFTKELKNKKCRGTEVHELCETQDLKMKDNGIVVVGANIKIYLEESFWFQRVKKFTEAELSDDNLRKLGFLSFLEDHSLELGGKPESNIFVAFYKYNKSKVPELTNICAVRAGQIELLIDSSKKESLTEKNSKVEKSFLKLEMYYTYY